MRENQEATIKVNVRSAYWDGPIEVEMSERVFNTPGLRLVMSVDRIIQEAKLISLIHLDPDFLDNLERNGELEFKRASDMPKESEPVVPLVEPTPVEGIQDAENQEQQEIRYEPEEPARDRLGYPPKNSAEEWRRGFPKS